MELANISYSPSSAPSYGNSTLPAPTDVPTSVGTITPPSTSAPAPIPTAGAGKVAALSGAGLAGVLGFAALLL